MRAFKTATLLVSLTTAYKTHNRTISPALFYELEELSRLVDIAYCVGFPAAGIQRPFDCLGRCDEFPTNELVTTWSTGVLVTDSCGYIALSHGPDPRVIVAFRGTYSPANVVADLSTAPRKYSPYHPDGSCANCTIHSGFAESWRVTEPIIEPVIANLKELYPSYRLVLTGHSLGGAVAALAGLTFDAKAWTPTVTTFGEPRIGNAEFAAHVDAVFDLGGRGQRFRRVTHVADPVPNLPLMQWDYVSHAGEIYISKPGRHPELQDVVRCAGQADPDCIAGADDSLPKWSAVFQSSLRAWELLSSHRDYFWRLGLCVPGSDPLNWGVPSYPSEHERA